MAQQVYQGKIWEGEFGDNSSALMVGYCSTPLAKRWKYDISRRTVSVRYWISETEKTKEELMENQVLRLAGSVQADYGDRYSDMTGYLWTDEALKVGGHNLMQELNYHIGKYLYMEVDYN